MRHRHIEDQEQIAVSLYLRLQYPDALFTCSGAGLITNARTGGKMKKLGYTAGTPDLMIFKPNKDYQGLFIEMKGPKGVISPLQKEWLEKLNSLGYKAVVCRGFREAKEVIDDYLK